jgi:putative transposase
MRKKRFSEPEILVFLKEAERCKSIPELAKSMGITERTYYRWKNQYSGVEPDHYFIELILLRREVDTLKKQNAELALDQALLRALLRKEKRSGGCVQQVSEA